MVFYFEFWLFFEFGYFFLLIECGRNDIGGFLDLDFGRFCSFYF